MDSHDPGVRRAKGDDAGACVEIYRPFVLDTAITFETEVPSVDEMAARIAHAQLLQEWLVFEDEAGVVGYAYARPFKERAAYRWSAEVSVYVSPRRHRGGVGRDLYAALLTRLADRGYRRVFAGITQPNEPSNRFHKSFGFRPAGVFERVGFKHGAWHDVAWMQLDVQADEVDPPPEIA